MAQISKVHKLNIRHVETSVASNCKQFERPITSQSQVSCLQRLCRALYKVFYGPNMNKLKYVYVSNFFSISEIMNIPHIPVMYH